MTSRSATLQHPADERRARIAVVGMGPRGTAVLERLVAASTTPTWRGRVDVHIIDPHVGLGGAVWRHDQSPVLLMNTATSQTTQYPDESCHPILPVPHRETLADHAAVAGIAVTECAPRAAFGRYLAHVLEQAEHDADPTRLRIHRHSSEVIDATGDADGPQLLLLADGTRLSVDAAAFALGHLPTAHGPRSRQYADAARRHGLVHIGPANPLDVDYTSLLGRERIAVQGLGLNFYDAIGMLTHVAGGRFVPDTSAPSGLRYLPGGSEPTLLAGSRSGMLFRPKPELPGILPEPYTPQVLTGERVMDLAVRADGVDHHRDVRPLMVAELSRALTQAGHQDLAEEQALMALLYPHGRGGGAVPDAHALSVDALQQALEASAGTPDRPGPDPAWLLIFRVLTALRIQVNRLAGLGAYTTDSLVADVDGQLKNAFASWASGPPVLRVRQVLALAEAGLLEFTGPGMRLEIDDEKGCFLAGAGERRLPCDGLLEAHLPPVDLSGSASPLLRAWRERGEIRRDHWDARGPRQVATGSIAVDGLYAPIGADGQAYERRLMLGVPVSTAQPGSQISAQPGTGAQLLVNAEAVAVRLAHAAGVL